jgi:hypothetical protein
VTKVSKAEQEQARQTLREWLPVGSTVHTVLRHVSGSGMSRDISLHLVRDDQIRDITYLVSQATGNRLSHRDGPIAIRIGGVGMDMGFALVYGLSRALYPDGHPCTGHGSSGQFTTQCPSNDHSNDYGTVMRDWQREHSDYDGRESSIEEVRAFDAYLQERFATDLGYRVGRQHSDGGYAISQRWI